MINRYEYKKKKRSPNSHKKVKPSKTQYMTMIKKLEKYDGNKNTKEPNYEPIYGTNLWKKGTGLKKLQNDWIKTQNKGIKVKSRKFYELVCTLPNRPNRRIVPRWSVVWECMYMECLLIYRIFHIVLSNI